MKVVIIEDEKPAANRLQKMLLDFSSGIKVEKTLPSVQEALLWFKVNDLPDLIFMDIELSDGTSFSVIEQANISCPIIFITAFDDYWQEAFEHNSIDYLLKPLQRDRLENALHKFQDLKKYFAIRYQNLLDYTVDEKKYKDRFLVKRGKEFISLTVEEIAFFYATHKLVCLVDKNGSRFILDSSLSEIARQVNPERFFRINRKYLVNLNAIKKIVALPKSKLLVEVKPIPPEELVISSENSSEFKNWMRK